MLELKWSGVSFEAWWRNEQFWVIAGISSHLAAVVQVSDLIIWPAMLCKIFLKRIDHCGVQLRACTNTHKCACPPARARVCVCVCVNVLVLVLSGYSQSHCRLRNQFPTDFQRWRWRRPRWTSHLQVFLASASGLVYRSFQHRRSHCWGCPCCHISSVTGLGWVTGCWTKVLVP